MKKVIVSLASLVVSLVLCGTAQAQAHRNRYGGSTSHSYGINEPHQRLRWQLVAHVRSGYKPYQHIRHQYVARLRWGTRATPTPTVELHRGRTGRARYIPRRMERQRTPLLIIRLPLTTGIIHPPQRPITEQPATTAFRLEAPRPPAL